MEALAPMTQKEMQAYLAANKGSRTIDKILSVAKTATQEQKSQLVAEAKRRYEAAQAEYDQEIAFRPSYATGPTRSENAKEAVLNDARKFYRFCMSV